MTARDFLPESQEGALRLDRLLAEYCRRERAPLLAHISLEAVSSYARIHPEGGRLFDYAVELQVQIAILQIDLAGIARGTEVAGSQSQSDEDRFCRQMSLLRLNSDFVFRYRAIWDKVMAILVLLAAPEQYGWFAGAHSRKRAFAKIATASGKLPVPLIKYIVQTTQEFDERYRTAEAHGSGSTRRLVSSDAHAWDSEQANMFWASNALNNVLIGLAAVFHPDR